MKQKHTIYTQINTNKLIPRKSLKRNQYGNQFMKVFECVLRMLCLLYATVLS